MSSGSIHGAMSWLSETRQRLSSSAVSYSRRLKCAGEPAVLMTITRQVGTFGHAVETAS
jgi:hypothetical protein